MRLEKTVRYLLARGAAGFLAYSEGDHDDLNKALVAGLGSGQYATADDVLCAYAKRHFGTNPAGWSELLHAMGDFEGLAPARCRPLFDSLAREARDTWRLRQIEGRLRLAEAHQAVLARTDWDAERMAAVEAFLSVKEHLYRNVWRLGLQRHAFRFETYLPAWYVEFAERRRLQHTKSHIDSHSEA